MEIPFLAMLLTLAFSLQPPASLLAAPMGTAFTYQGQLNDNGSPARGIYDLRFTLYDNIPGNLVGGPVTNSAVEVTNGLFTAVVQFAPGAFDGTERWLVVSVRTNGGGAFTDLTPPRVVATTPYALYSVTAGSLAASGGGPLELMVNHTRVLRLEAGATSANVIAGWSNNTVPPSVIGATISGGGASTGAVFYPAPDGGYTRYMWYSTSNTVTTNFGTVGGGMFNGVHGEAGTVSGGVRNWIGDRATAASIGGGYGNYIGSYAHNSTIAGGNNNQIGTNAPGAVVGGGRSNRSTGEAATVPGGRDNTAAGRYSLAAGYRATALHDGAWVWADSADVDFSSTGPDQFLLRATGGVGINTNNPQSALHVHGTITADNFSGSGTGLTNLSASSLADSSIASAKLANDFTSLAKVTADAMWADNARRITVDPYNLNTGTVSYAAMTFGFASGEGIASKRNSGGNQYGLDLFTSSQPRLSINGAGNVGIGTTGPQSLLSVVKANPGGRGGEISIVNDAPSTNGSEAALNFGVESSTYNGESPSAQIKARLADANNRTDLYFKLWSGTAGFVECARLGYDLTDSEPNLRVDGTLRAFRLTSYSTLTLGAGNPGVDILRLVDAYDSPNIIGGYAANYASNTSGVFIGGGGKWSTPNGARADYTVIGGGYNNLIYVGADQSVIAGGQGNRISTNAISSAIGGGYYNRIHTNTSYGTIGGGQYNTNSGDYATVPGGSYNVAGGNYSFAAGRRAKANHTGSLVWADSQNADFASTDTNQFLLRAEGGVGINTNNPQQALHVVGNILATGTITPSSDRHAKTGFAGVDAAEVLDRVAKLPIQQWRFKTEPEETKHIGPMAQDFRAAFGLGQTPTAIATVDADGVALAAIQGLNQKLEEQLRAKDAELQALKQRLEAIERRLSKPDSASGLFPSFRLSATAKTTP